VEALGTYHEPAVVERLLAQLGLLAALGLTGLFEQLQIGLRSTETKRWWASNGRDLLNGLALASLWLALWASGFSGPIALAGAALLLLGASLIESALSGASSWPRWLSFPAMFALGSPVLVAPRAVHLGLRWAIELLF
jgi:hypothetical protein